MDLHALSSETSYQEPGSEAPLPSQVHSSCTNCRLRKVRCNSEAPCQHCIKRDEECSYQTVSLRRRGPGKKSNHRELLKRIKAMESLLIDRINDHMLEKGSSDLEAEPDSFNGVAKTEINFQLSYDPETNCHLKPIHHSRYLIAKENKAVYTTDILFAELASQVEDMYALLLGDDDEYSEGEPVSPIQKDPSLQRAFYIPGVNSMNDSGRIEHPEHSQISLLWRVYLRNVEPLVKMFHVPSVQLHIDDIIQNPRRQSPDVDAVVCGIYLAALTSLHDNDVQIMLGGQRSILLPLYRARLEQALCRAKLLNTKCLMTLQALVLLIISNRRTMSAQYVWMLNGIAIRIARALGLHKDGASFQLNPFECELRRRVWWQIYYLEVKTSEDNGCELSIAEDSFDTKLPSNINDQDIHQEISMLPPTQRGRTDMSFMLARIEMISIELLVQRKPTPEMTDEEYRTRCEMLITSKCEEVHAKYLHDFVLDDPQSCITTAIVDLVAKRTLLRINLGILCEKRFGQPSQHFLDTLFQQSIDLLEASIYLETEKIINRWAWQSRKNVQWHAVVFVLTQLGTHSSVPMATTAWRAIDTIFEDHDNATRKDDHGFHFRLILHLLERARAQRALGNCKKPDNLNAENLDIQEHNGPVTYTNMNDDFLSGMNLNETHSNLIQETEYGIESMLPWVTSTLQYKTTWSMSDRQADIFPENCYW